MRMEDDESGVNSPHPASVPILRVVNRHPFGSNAAAPGSTDPRGQETEHPGEYPRNPRKCAPLRRERDKDLSVSHPERS